jgi:ABC-type polysaccharide/polyol phosphate export permease
MGDALKAIVSGAMVMAYLTAGLFFFRFWRETRDRLFAAFGTAFVLLAVQRCALSLLPHADTNEAAVWLYALRLFAFLLILAAIIDKNRAG